MHDLAALIEERNRRLKMNKMATYFTGPDRLLYHKHMEYFKAGLTYSKRLFMAANRVGKSTAAAYEIACHITGRYPEWWEGKRFSKGQNWWVIGDYHDTVRAILQVLLLGDVGEIGTGMVPYDAIDHSSIKDAKKTDTAIKVFRVHHTSGGYSTVELKANEQGRKAFQGTARCIWIDEECSKSVYDECVTRTMTGDNILMMTFTPLQGRTEVVNSFLGKDGDANAEGETGLGKYVVRCTWDDVPHLTEKAKAEMLDEYLPYQRDARSKGIPSLGSGAIYGVPKERFVIPGFAIPKHWPKYYGFDVGMNTAMVFFAKDPDTGKRYVYDSVLMKGELPSTHAAAIIARGKWLRGAIDTSARGRSSTDGENLRQMYEDLGLNITNADKAVEAGIYTIYELLVQGLMFVFESNKDFLIEYDNYHRSEDGKIVKTKDHLMDAWRYGEQTEDIAWTEAEANLALNPPAQQPSIQRAYHSPQSWALS